MILTPFLVNWAGIDGMLTTYGVLSAVAAVAFFVLAKERPLTPPCHIYQEERALAIDGLKQIFHKKDFNWLMFIFFIGLGVFNAVTTWIENIVYPRGFSSEQAGITGGLMIVGGLVGAVVIPMLSDYYKKRIPFIIIALAGATISLAGIAFATHYWLLLVSGGAFGFFLLSSGPIGFQYGAEITYPVSEGTSNGFLLLMGQISGIAFIFGMDSFKSPETGSMTKPLILMIGLMVLSFLATLRLRESSFLSKPAEERAD
jgi:Na+/melibiose symporter-like transporter